MKSHIVWNIGLMIGRVGGWIMQASGWTPTRRKRTRKPTGRKPGRPRKNLTAPSVEVLDGVVVPVVLDKTVL